MRTRNDLMKRELLKSYLYRKRYMKKELYHYIYRGINKSFYQPLVVGGYAKFLLFTSIEEGGRSRIRNVCLNSGRYRSVLNYVRLNRCSMHNFIRDGQIAGLRTIS